MGSNGSRNIYSTGTDGVESLVQVRIAFGVSHLKKKNENLFCDIQLATFVLFCFADLVLWSRHLVFWSLGTLTGLSEILRQGTGCVKERY